MAKPNKRPSKVVKVVTDPTFFYTSRCCNEQATKAPLAMPTNRGIGSLGARPETETQGLGGWRCTKCRKACSVSRTVNKKEKAEVPA